MTTDRESGGGNVRPEDSETWPVVLYRGARDNRPKPQRWDAGTMVRALARHRVWTGEKVDAPAWSPVEIPDGERRAAKNVSAVSMLVLDCDSGESLDTLEELGDDYARLGHTSWSHTTGHPKVRLVFPFHPDRPCPAAEWAGVWGAAARWAASQGVQVDQAAKDPSRLYFGPYIPPDVVAREEAESWVYGPGEGPGGRLPARTRRWLSWAWLVTTYPEPEPELAVRVPDISFGSEHDSTDRHERRRRSFAMGLVRYRADKLSRAGSGGRNSSLFGAARMVAQLGTAGAVDTSVALGELEAAALQSGLGAKETRRTIASGFAAGGADPAFDLDREMGQ